MSGSSQAPKLLMRKKQAEARNATNAIVAKAWETIPLEVLTHRLKPAETKVMTASPV
jgi:hypothetical protein